MLVFQNYNSQQRGIKFSCKSGTNNCSSFSDLNMTKKNNGSFPATAYEAFSHVETLFVEGNQVHTDQNKPKFFINKKNGLF